MIRIMGILYLELDVVKWPIIVHMVYEGTSAQATPVLYDDHTVASCNHLSGDNKGGVIVSVSVIMRPTNITEFSFTGGSN